LNFLIINDKKKKISLEKKEGTDITSSKAHPERSVVMGVFLIFFQSDLRFLEN
jgi:hypothetical protein